MDSMTTQKLTLNWSKLTQLNESEISKLPEKGGVFRLSERNSEGKFIVFFVGKAINLRTELLKIFQSEANDEMLNKYLKVKTGTEIAFKYAPNDNEETRRSVERQMYQHYLPIMNTQEPEASMEIEANLN